MTRKFGHYRLLEKLGEGGMGEVHAAFDEVLQRKVAIKTIRRGGGDDKARERLWREARAAARVSHPSICQVFEVGEEGEVLFIAMELLEGETLADVLDGRVLSPTEAIDTALAILGALEVLHAQGFVHRDLKPSNVFLTAHGVKLLDFGLALPLEQGREPGARLTETGMFMGTPGFMAPEQWAGGVVGPPADLFAVGALLFEMASGVPAFEGKDLVAVHQAVMVDGAPSLTGGPGMAALDAVVQRALAKRPEDRFPDARSMATALRQVRTQLDVGETPSVRRLQRLLVVPFHLQRADPEIAFLSFGLADALSASLAAVPSLVVQSAHVGARFEGPTPDLKAIAQETGVSSVLTGALLRSGNRLRVTTRLLHVPEGTLTWSDTRTVEIGDVFDLQDDLAKEIAGSLSAPLGKVTGAHLQRDVPANPQAYEYYLRANQLGYDFTTLSAARDLYREALKLDPKYAPAWARLGRVYRVMAKYGHGARNENIALAGEAFQKALALNPRLPTAHNLYAYYEIEELGRSKGAMLRLLEQARGTPNDAELLAGLVVSCRFCGLLDASLEADRKARRLDPGLRTSVAYTYWMLGDYERAMGYDDEHMQWMSPYVLPLLGRGDEAVELCRRLEEQTPRTLERSMVRCIRTATEGDAAGCSEAGRTVLAGGFGDPEGIYFLARSLAHVHRDDEALQILERVVAGGFSVDHVFRNDPWLASLQGGQRFESIVERAAEGRREAERAYLQAGGDKLLGPIGPSAD